jgi:dihydroorotate dehydrogenase electron transfer subunit
MTVTTDDGSAGTKGQVISVLPGLIERYNIEIIYSCGPMPMLAAVQEVAQKFGIIHQCAVEEAMACGIGVCMTCVIPLRDANGEIRMSRSCIDGPVMDGANVIWNSKSEIPKGTVGEPHV